jgi:hypothetical protein
VSKSAFLQKIRKKNVNNVLAYKFEKKLSFFSIKIHAERCVPTKKNKKKNVNNILVYKIKKKTLHLVNYLQIRAERYVPTKKIKKKNVNNVLVYKFKQNSFLPYQLPPGSCRKVHSYKMLKILNILILKLFF